MNAPLQKYLLNSGFGNAQMGKDVSTGYTVLCWKFFYLPCFRHALPQGYILKKDRKKMEEQNRLSKITLEEFIENEVFFNYMLIRLPIFANDTQGDWPCTVA